MKKKNKYNTYNFCSASTMGNKQTFHRFPISTKDFNLDITNEEMTNGLRIRGRLEYLRAAHEYLKHHGGVSMVSKPSIEYTVFFDLAGNEIVPTEAQKQLAYFIQFATRNAQTWLGQPRSSGFIIILEEKLFPQLISLGFTTNVISRWLKFFWKISAWEAEFCLIVPDDARRINRRNFQSLRTPSDDNDNLN